MGIQLGDSVKDRITGYTGIVIGITDWLHGCRRMTVQSQELKDGKPPDSLCIDEPQLEIVESGAYKKPKPTTLRAVGGPIPVPQRRPNATR